MSDVITALNWVNDAIFASLVNTTLQITLLISLIALIIRVFRIRSAPTRYSLWLFALIAMLTLPILTPFIPQIDFTRLHLQGVANYGLDDRMSLGMETSNAGDMSMAGGSVASPSAEKSILSEQTNVSLINPVSIAYFIWLAGALSMLCRTIVVYGKLRKLRLCSSDVESKAALEVLSRLRKKLGIRRAVTLKSSPQVYAPIGLGVFSPTIILPDGVMDGGPVEELEMILTHELAHIKRLDYLVRFLQNVLKVFFFFHPLFHLLKRNLAREREHICDDWVIHVTEHRSRYAECLVDMLERVASNPVNIPVTVAMAERKQDVPGRIDMIVDKTRKTATKVSRKTLIAVLLTGCLSLPITAGIGLIRIARARPASCEERIVFTRGGQGNRNIWVMAPDGGNQKRLTISGEHTTPAWSPDGGQIAFSSSPGGNADIYVMDADGFNVRQLTNSPEHDYDPTWSPDGKQIAFDRNVWEQKPDGSWEHKICDIYVMNSDGSNERILSEKGVPFLHGNPDWSPDGKKIVFENQLPKQWGIWIMDADGNDWEKLDSRAKVDPAWSPDGKSIAATGWSGNLSGIYVMDADGGNIERLTELGSQARYPAWSPDGTEIAFCSDRDLGEGEWGIYVMNADGSNVRQITKKSVLERYHVAMWPDWTAFSYAVEPVGKLKSTWGKIKTLLLSH